MATNPIWESFLEVLRDPAIGARVDEVFSVVQPGPAAVAVVLAAIDRLHRQSEHIRRQQWVMLRLIQQLAHGAPDPAQLAELEREITTLEAASETLTGAMQANP